MPPTMVRKELRYRHLQWHWNRLSASRGCLYSHVRQSEANDNWCSWYGDHLIFSSAAPRASCALCEENLELSRLHCMFHIRCASIRWCRDPMYIRHGRSPLGSNDSVSIHILDPILISRYLSCHPVILYIFFLHDHIGLHCMRDQNDCASVVSILDSILITLYRSWSPVWSWYMLSIPLRITLHVLISYARSVQVTLNAPMYVIRFSFQLNCTFWIALMWQIFSLSDMSTEAQNYMWDSKKCVYTIESRSQILRLCILIISYIPRSFINCILLRQMMEFHVQCRIDELNLFVIFSNLIHVLNIHGDSSCWVGYVCGSTGSFVRFEEMRSPLSFNHMIESISQILRLCELIIFDIPRF